MGVDHIYQVSTIVRNRHEVHTTILCEFISTHAYTDWTNFKENTKTDSTGAQFLSELWLDK